MPTLAVTNTSAGEITLQARLGLLLVTPLSGLAQAGLSPILPKISAHFAGEPQVDVLVRLLVSSVPFAMIFGSAAGGFLADRLGQRRTLLWALLGYAMAGSAGFVLNDLRAVLASRFVLGMFNAACGVIAAAIITTRVRAATRDKWLGFFTMAGTLGSIVILVLVGIAGAYHWQWVFLFYLLAIPVLLLLRITLPADGQSSRAPDEAKRGRFPWSLAGFGFACGVVAATTTLFLPYHLAHIGETQPQRVAGALVANGLVGAAVSFRYGWIRKRLGIIQVFVLGFGAAAAGTAIIVSVPTYAGAITGVAFMGSAIGLLGPNLFAAVAAATPHERQTRIIGLVRTVFYSAPLLSQIPLELVSQRFGIAGALMVLAIFEVLMIALSTLARTRFKSMI